MKTTKELARELGLLRKRTVSTSSVGVRDRRDTTDQPFKYLIVIDFESTCWQDAKFKFQEIIEFPAVLLNTESGQIESEFHYYVQPEEQPTLSKFCTDLTGISQEKVDEGIPISLCLKKFTHWLYKIHREKAVVCHGSSYFQNSPVNAICVTWSDWDLGVCLLYECKRKQILKPPQLNSWIDLRATYRKFYERKPEGLNGALKDLGIDFQGREHAGIDDARNTAKLAFRMIRDGCKLSVTKNLQNKDKERSASCNPSIHNYFVEPKNSASKIISLGSTPNKMADSCQVKKSGKTPSKIPVRLHVHNNSEAVSEITMSITPNKCCSTAISEGMCLPAFKSSYSNSETTEKTEVKQELSIKRKFLAPTEIVGESSHLPCRKMLCKISPKQVMATNIYQDLVGNTEQKPSCTIASRANGLQEHNMQDQRSDRNTDAVKSTVIHQPDLRVCPVSSPDHVTIISVTHGSSNPVATKPALKIHKSDSLGPMLVNQSNNAMPQSFKNVSTPPLRPWKPVACNASVFKVPNQTPILTTPNNSNSSTVWISSTLKMTPPLCKCGHRCKRRMAQSPGQNMGRFFFSCSARQRVGSNDGCEFFKWEDSKNVGTSSALSKQFTAVVEKSPSHSYSAFQKKNLGMKLNSNSQIKYLR